MSKAIMEVTGVSAPVAAALRELVRPDGSLRDIDVKEAARDPESPLHHYFEWDPDKAHEELLLIQARALIRRVKVKIIREEDKAPVRVRAYVSKHEIGANGSGSGSYVPIEDIPGHAALETGLRSAMRRDLERLKKRYADVQWLLREMAEEILGEDDADADGGEDAA
jgi:hypothetical protein